MRRLAWAVLSAFALGALIAFAVSLLRQPRELDVTGYDPRARLTDPRPREPSPTGVLVCAGASESDR